MQPMQLDLDEPKQFFLISNNSRKKGNGKIPNIQGRTFIQTVKLKPKRLDSMSVINMLLKTCVSLSFVRALSTEELGFQVAVVSLVIFS